MREREREVVVVVVGGIFGFTYNLYIRIFHTICVCQSIARPYLSFFIYFKLDCPVPRYRRCWGVFLGVCRWPGLIFRG